MEYCRFKSSGLSSVSVLSIIVESPAATSLSLQYIGRRSRQRTLGLRRRGNWIAYLAYRHVQKDAWRKGFCG